MIEEFKHNNLIKNDTNPTIKCKVFEDNSGALEMASVHKHRPRTKHLNAKLHHFTDCVTRGDIEMLPISTTDKLVDFLTKPVNERLLVGLRKKAMGWRTRQVSKLDRTCTCQLK